MDFDGEFSQCCHITLPYCLQVDMSHVSLVQVSSMFFCAGGSFWALPADERRLGQMSCDQRYSSCRSDSNTSAVDWLQTTVLFINPGLSIASSGNDICPETNNTVLARNIKIASTICIRVTTLVHMTAIENNLSQHHNCI